MIAPACVPGLGEGSGLVAAVGVAVVGVVVVVVVVVVAAVVVDAAVVVVAGDVGVAAGFAAVLGPG